MNVLDIPKYLIYMPKKDLKAYGVGEEGTVGDQIYRCLRKYQWPIPRSSSEYYYFDEAWYVCVVVLHHWDPVTFLKEWKEKETPRFPILRFIKMHSLPNRILGMVYAYLNCITIDGLEGEHGTLAIEKRIEVAKEYISKVIRKASVFCIKQIYFLPTLRSFLKLKIEGSIPSSAFVFTKPEEIVYAAVNWYKMTNHYDRREVFSLVTFIANNHEERMMLLDKVILGAKRDRTGQWIGDDVLEDLDKLRSELATHPAYHDEETQRKIAMLDKDAEFVDFRKELEPAEEVEQPGQEKSWPHLPQSRDEKFGRELYRFLINANKEHKYQYIPSDTREDCWLYVMGFSEIPPRKFKRVQWKCNKQIFRLMIKALYDPQLKAKRLTISELELPIYSCFLDMRGLPFKYGNNEKRHESDEQDKLKEFLSDHLPGLPEDL